MKTALLSALIASAFACSAAAHAGTLVDVSVIDRDTGSTLPTYRHDGKLYVAGTPGHRYAVRIANRTAARVMTVLSVDGVNAITGQTADPYQSGYVLEPWQNTEVDGWRKNMSEVAQFNFTALSDSYAAKTGRPNNVGVIGVAVFREKYRPPLPPIERERDDKISQATPVPPPAAEAPVDTARAASPAPAGAGAATAQAARPAASADSSNYAGVMERKSESLGTGHGARESSVATYTAFERESTRPNEIDSIWYDSHRNLVARGIIPAPRPIAVEPQPFPNQFVPDPAN